MGIKSRPLLLTLTLLSELMCNLMFPLGLSHVRLILMSLFVCYNENEILCCLCLCLCVWMEFSTQTNALCEIECGRLVTYSHVLHVLIKGNSAWINNEKKKPNGFYFRQIPLLPANHFAGHWEPLSSNSVIHPLIIKGRAA